MKLSVKCFGINKPFLFIELVLCLDKRQVGHFTLIVTPIKRQGQGGPSGTVGYIRRSTLHGISGTRLSLFFHGRMSINGHPSIS